jgi:Peptidase family C25
MWSFSVFYRISVLAVVFLFSISALQSVGNSSRLEGSVNLKIFVEYDGFYRLNHEELLANGFDSLLNPQNIQLFTDGIEQAIKVNSDGSIEFFGKQTKSRWTTTKTYWLKHAETTGKRIQTSKVKFDETVENRQINNEIKNEEKNFRAIYIANGEHDNFYSASLYNANPYSQTIDLQGFIDSSQTVLEIAVQGYSNSIHNISVVLNNTEIGVLNFNYQSRFVKQFSVPTYVLGNGENSLKLISNNSSGTVLLEYAKVFYQKKALAVDNVLKFNLSASKSVRVGGFEKEKLNVLDITNPSNVQEIKVQTVVDDEEKYSFTLPAGVENRTIWSQIEEYESVADIKTDTPSSLKSIENEADFVILTHKNFLESLEPLKLKREREGLQTKIVNVEDVYDEFNFGEKSPLAIKEFMRYAVNNWHLPPRYLLLAGDSSSDPKRYLSTSTEDFMPSFMADTIYFPMEASSDDSFTDFNNDNIADIPTGRLSVKTEAETENIINKIIRYEETQISSKFRSALLVSDAPISYDFPAMSDEVKLSLPSKMTKLKINRNDGTAEQVRQDILNSINQGFNIVNFLGHGNTANWTSASLLRSTDGATLTNELKPSIFVMLACLNGSFAESDVSLAESLQKSNGGAVAVWASSGLTYAYGQVEMSKSFYRKIYSQPNIRIGDAVKYAKGTMQDNDIRRFSIWFGDPTMHFKP